MFRLLMMESPLEMMESPLQFSDVTESNLTYTAQPKSQQACGITLKCHFESNLCTRQSSLNHTVLFFKASLITVLLFARVAAEKKIIS